MDDQILDLLCKASGSGFAEYDEMREFCKNRDSREWGIPAIICLDDLTDPDRPAYEMSEVDEKLHERMAVEAMLFNYVQDRTGEDLRGYPTIAPSMSAMAEKLFYADENGDPVSYRDIIDGRYVK